jgi:hypothetical protein
MVDLRGSGVDLVDNFHIVDEQLREIRDDLPPDYYRELPKLAGGHLQGYPRLGLAWAYIATRTAASSRRACDAWCAPTRPWNR